MIQRVKRDTLASQVAQGLMDYIDASELAPGDSLPSEAQLSDEFGVSRPVIREALKTLQGEGMIDIATGKSATIRPVSSAILRRYFERAVALNSTSFRDLIEVRRGLEYQSVTLAAQRRSDADIAALDLLLYEMDTHMKSHEDYAELDIQFHLTIAQASQNPMLVHLVESIRDAMREIVLQGLRNRFQEEDYIRVQKLHERILNAIKAQDVDAATDAMREHFGEAVNALPKDAQ